MRTYRVTMQSEIVGTLTVFPLARDYQEAAQIAIGEVTKSPEHGKYAPWTEIETEVSG